MNALPVAIPRVGALFFICRRFRQNRRLNEILFLLFFGLIDRLPARIHEARRNKDDQVALDVLIDIGPEQSTNKRDIADDWRAIFGFLNVLTHQAAQHDGLSIPNAHAGSYLAGTKDRLIDYVRRKDTLGRTNQTSRHAVKKRR